MRGPGVETREVRGREAEAGEGTGEAGLLRDANNHIPPPAPTPSTRR
jgi:hypothetical protein